MYANFNNGKATNVRNGAIYCVDEETVKMPFQNIEICTGATTNHIDEKYGQWATMIGNGGWDRITE